MYTCFYTCTVLYMWPWPGDKTLVSTLALSPPTPAYPRPKTPLPQNLRQISPPQLHSADGTLLRLFSLFTLLTRLTHSLTLITLTHTHITQCSHTHHTMLTHSSHCSLPHHSQYSYTHSLTHSLLISHAGMVQGR